jgi:ABC-type glycerol-3-phosphate transport system substrate-binding protein
MARTLICMAVGLVMVGLVGCGMMGGSSSTQPSTEPTTMMSK